MIPAVAPAHYAAPALGGGRLLVRRLTARPLARRLLTLEEAAALMGYRASVLADLVDRGVVPAARLPGSDGKRGPLRIPATATDRTGEPRYVSVAAAAAAIGLDKSAVNELIRGGLFCSAVARPGHQARISVASLDAWIGDLVATSGRVGMSDAEEVAHG